MSESDMRDFPGYRAPVNGLRFARPVGLPLPQRFTGSTKSGRTRLGSVASSSTNSPGRDHPRRNSRSSESGGCWRDGRRFESLFFRQVFRQVPRRKSEIAANLRARSLTNWTCTGLQIQNVPRWRRIIAPKGVASMSAICFLPSSRRKPGSIPRALSVGDDVG